MALGLQLGLVPALQESGIVLETLELFELIEVVEPVLADHLIQQATQLRVAEAHPAPWCDAVGDVGEFLRPQLSKFRHQVALHQIAVELGHAVDVVGAHGGEVRHAHGLLALFINDRELAQDGVIAGVLQPHLLQEAAIDLKDQFQMARQQAGEQGQTPFLQGFG